jgi:hypothetical protein
VYDECYIGYLSTRRCDNSFMEKLLLALCLLVALSSILNDVDIVTGKREILIDAGRQCRIKIRVEPSGSLEWEILLGGRILKLTYSGRECFAHWRPCHA